MSEPIKVGDLVQIIRGALCCGGGDHIGHVFVVQSFRERPSSPCLCGTSMTGTNAVRAGLRGFGYDVLRLKRIPPLSELEGEKRDEEITA